MKFIVIAAWLIIVSACTLYLCWFVVGHLAHGADIRETLDDHGNLTIVFDDQSVEICPLHSAAFDGTVGVTAYVTTCAADTIFDNGFEP